MEVHHHPDLHHKPKPWKEYLLEGLMIFIAVTLGFIAESIRENIGKSEKEGEYVNSFVGDLIQDTTNLNDIILENQHKLEGLDSLLSLANADLTEVHNRQLLYKFSVASISFYSRFISNNATMMQLKNAGGFQYIRRHHAADSIALYDQNIQGCYAAEAPYAKAINDGMDAMSQLIVFNRKNNKGSPSDYPLLTNNPQQIAVFFNKVALERGWTNNYIQNLDTQKPFTNRLIDFLKKEYDIN